MGAIQGKFQFHKGTIRTDTALLWSRSIFLFQFHKGTIRTPVLSLCIVMPLAFQFHKGTIRTLPRAANGTEISSISIP